MAEQKRTWQAPIKISLKPEIDNTLTWLIVINLYSLLLPLIVLRAVKKQRDFTVSTYNLVSKERSKPK